MIVTHLFKKNEKVISTDIVEEISHVFLENYLYLDKIDLDVFIERVYSQKWTISKLNQYFSNIRHDPYTKIFKATEYVSATNLEYLDLLNGVFYIKIRDFYDIENIAMLLQKKKYQHLIVDLTDNVGGYVKNVIYLAALLTPQEDFVELKYRDKTKMLKRGDVNCINIPKITLFTSENTVSCGEIFTYLIMEFHNNSLLIGCKTYGKSSGQVTWDNRKYGIKFVVTAYIWYINGMDCKTLQKKYIKYFSDIQYNRDLFIMTILD